jgi:WD40 repeat protein
LAIDPQPDQHVVTTNDTNGRAAAVYDVFVSYSHRDKSWARWLRRALRQFSLPGPAAYEAVNLASDIAAGSRPFQRIFLDEEAIAAGPDLPLRLQSALRTSRCLVVICSPSAAHSRWVEEEIRLYRDIVPEARVFGFIVAGEPGVSPPGQTEPNECFPPSLRFTCRARGDIVPTTEIVAADARISAETEPSLASRLFARLTGDVRQLAFAKLVAGVLNLDVELLSRREQRRQTRRITAIAAASIIAAVVLAGLTLYAFEKINQAEAQLRKTLSRQFSAQSRDLTGPLAYLLPLYAIHFDATPVAFGALKSVLERSPQLVEYIDTSSPPRDVIFSAEGDTIASAHGSAGVAVWSAKPLAPGGVPRKPLAVLTIEFPVYVVRFGASGRMLAAAGDGDVIPIWDTVSWTRTSALRVHARALVTALAISIDGRRVAAATSDGALYLWTMVNDDWQASPPMRLEEGATALAFSRDTSSLVIATPQRLLTLKSIDHWPQPERLSCGTAGDLGLDPVPRMAVSPDERWVAVTAQPNRIRIFECGAVSVAGPVLAGHLDRVLDVAFAHDGASLLSVGRDQHTIAWSTRDWTESAIYPSTIGIDGTLALHDTDQPPLFARRFGNVSDWVNRVERGLSDQDVAVATLRGAVVVVGVGDGQQRQLVRDPDQRSVEALARDAEHSRLFWATSDGRLRSFSPMGVAVDLPNAGIDGRITAAAYLRKTNALATGDWNGDISCRPMTGAGTVVTRRIHGGHVHDIATSDNGLRFASVGADGKLVLWDAVACKEEATSGWPSSGIPIRVAFSPDGSELAAVADSGVLMRFSAATASPVAPDVSAHPGGANAVRYHPTLPWIVTGGSDKQLAVWDRATGQLVTRIQAHDDVVTAIEFDAAGHWLYSSAGDGELSRHLLSVNEWRRLACAKAGRDIGPEEWQRLTDTPKPPGHAICAGYAQP